MVSTCLPSLSLHFRWLSTGYMTWALLGITHPASEGNAGWAWVPIQLDVNQDNTVVANAMSEFVAQNLRRLQQEEAGNVIPEEKRTLGNATMKSDTAVGVLMLLVTCTIGLSCHSSCIPEVVLGCHEFTSKWSQFIVR